MKTLFICLLILILLSSFKTDPVTPDCKCKGIRLYGKVRIVSAFEDFKVRIVSANEDLLVDTTGNGAQGCGDWRFVSGSADFKIRFVDAFEDFKIRIVTFRHGLPNR